MGMGTKRSAPLYWSTLSSCLGIFVIAITCTIAIPVFPNFRQTNTTQQWIGIFSYLVGIVFLLCEIQILTKIRTIYYRLWRCTIKLILPENYHNFTYGGNDEIEHNLLGYGFFGCYFVMELWRIISQWKFLSLKTLEVKDCFNCLTMISNNLQLIFAVLIMIAIIFKDSSRQGNKWSWFGWSFVGAVSFGSAFKHTVEEIIWGYLEAVELDLEHPNLCLNITHNCTRVDNCVPLMFQNWTRCLKQTVLADAAEKFLHLVPASTEFFSLATFFCVVTWRALGRDKSSDEHSTTGTEQLQEDNPACSISVSSPPVSAENENPGRIGGPAEVATEPLNFPTNFKRWMRKFLVILTSPTGLWGFVVSGVIVGCIGVTFYLFQKQMNAHQFNDAILIFMYQQFILQLILLISEVTFYVVFLRRVPTDSIPPHHLQLDVLLLIFPLLPLGILCALSTFGSFAAVPRNSSPCNATAIQMESNIPAGWLWINSVAVGVKWGQVAFQAMFLSEVFCRVKAVALRRSKYFFLIIGTLNFCIWASWTFECKQVALHGVLWKVYGTIEWIVIVYSTVPFVLFCFAHAAACCWEISKSIESVDAPTHHSRALLLNLQADGQAPPAPAVE